MRLSARFSSPAPFGHSHRHRPGYTSPTTLHLAQQADSLLVVADWQPGPELIAPNPAGPLPTAQRSAASRAA